MAKKDHSRNSDRLPLVVRQKARSRQLSPRNLRLFSL